MLNSELSWFILGLLIPVLIYGAVKIIKKLSQDIEKENLTKKEVEIKQKIPIDPLNKP